MDEVVFCDQAAKYAVGLRLFTSSSSLACRRTSDKGQWLMIARSLAAVNFLLAGVGITQVTRILVWQSSQRTGSVEEAAARDAKDVAETAKGFATDPQRAARKVEAEVK